MYIVGKYLDTPGNDEFSDCIDCEPGKYALAGSDVIIPVGGKVICAHPC